MCYQIICLLTNYLLLNKQEESAREQTPWASITPIFEYKALRSPSLMGLICPRTPLHNVDYYWPNKLISLEMKSIIVGQMKSQAGILFQILVSAPAFIVAHLKIILISNARYSWPHLTNLHEIITIVGRYLWNEKWMRLGCTYHGENIAKTNPLFWGVIREGAGGLLSSPSVPLRLGWKEIGTANTLTLMYKYFYYKSKHQCQ